MTRQSLYLDEAVGEARGVLMVEGRPERLLIERDTDPASQRLGATSTARIRRIEAGLDLAFLQMADGPDGVLPLNRDLPPLTEGLSVEVEVVAEGRPGAAKGVVLRFLREGAGPPRLIDEGVGLAARLAHLAPGHPVMTGEDAREAADLAQDAALAQTHPLPGGGSICIQPTRALIAVDVDAGGRAGSDPKRVARQANLAAIAETARLLRLKGLGGLVVIDLVGKGHDGKLMSEAAAAAFAPEGLTVGIGPISRFGLFELSIPRSVTPLADRLLDADGQTSFETAALEMIRAIEREGRAMPGARVTAWCAFETAEAAKPFLTTLAGRMGHRFQVETRPGMGRRHEVAVR